MTAVVAYGAAEVEVSLALGMESGTGRWDDPAALFNVTRWAQPDSALGDWIDLTCSTLSVRLAMGGQEPEPIVPMPVAGTAALIMVGDLFDPWGGPWAGLIGEGVRARVRARKPGTSAWQTTIDGMITHYGWDPLELTADIEVTDQLMLLNSDLPAVDPPQGSGETATARMTRLLDRAGWTGGRDLTAGGVPMLPTTLDGAAITSMRTIAESDMGLLGMTRAGTVHYVPGSMQPVTPIGGTLTVCPIDPADPLPYSWAWTTGTGTITPTATGVIVTPDPRGAATNYYCRATSSSPLPSGVTYRVACRARLISGTPNGFLRLLLGHANQTSQILVDIPTDGSWVQAAGSIVTTPSSLPAYTYVGTAGTAQVTVEVDGLVMYDMTGLSYDPTVPLARLVTLQTQQDSELLNIASISRQSDEGTEADTITVRDDTSVARYGPRTYKRTDLQHQDVAQSQRIANTLVARGAWPSRPPAAIQLDTVIDPAAALMLLTVDPLTRMQLIMQDSSSQQVLVTGWNVDLDWSRVVGALYVGAAVTVDGVVFDRASWDRDRWEAA